VELLTGKGDGSFSMAPLFSPTGQGPRAIAVADFNGDGRPDIAVANNLSNTVTVLLTQAQLATATVTGVSPTGTGTHLVNASYPGESIYNSSSSAAVGLTARLLAPQMTLAASSAAVVAGAQVTLTATVTGSTAKKAPTGKVAFVLGNATLGTSALNARGVATLATSSLPTGKDSITASYSGDSIYSTFVSSPVSVTVNKTALTAQTIAFKAPTSPVTYGTASLTLSASASSGLAVSFSVAGPASLSGNSLKITGAGTVVVTAHQAGNSSFAAAPDVAHTIQVNKAMLTVAASNVSIKYGQKLPSLTYSVAGYVNGDRSSVLKGAPAETTTAVKGSPVGAYPIEIARGTLTAANYGFVFKNATLTITSEGTTATPVFKLAAGTYKSAQSVTIADATTGAAIYYTTNGKTPTTSSTKYTGAIKVKATETVKAVAVASGYASSAVASAAYTIK
jgi:hypothetical protein